MKKRLWSLILGIGLLTALIAIPLSAQTPPAGGNGGGNGGAGGNGGGGRGRGGFDPAARMAQLQKDLGATDDEWKVLEPKITKLNDLRRADMMARFGGGMGGRGRGRPGGQGGADTGAGAAPANPAADNPVAKAAADLKAVLDNKDSTPDQIKDKLAALRDARTKAKDELTKAQADLKAVITVRQEAVLVNQGMLE